MWEATACSFFINRIQTERRGKYSDKVSGAAVRCPRKCPGFLLAFVASRFHHSYQHSKP